MMCQKKICIQFHVCTFLLRCSDAFYNLKDYVIQNVEGRRKKWKHAKNSTIIYHDALLSFLVGSDNVLKLGTLNIPV